MQSDNQLCRGQGLQKASRLAGGTAGKGQLLIRKSVGTEVPWCSFCFLMRSLGTYSKAVPGQA